MNTIFFAAGASYGFFNPNLSTTYLTEKVCDKKEWEPIIKKYRSFAHENTVVADAETVTHIISTILKHNRDANFEQIAEVIDKISSYSMDFSPQHNLLNLFELTLLDLLIGKGNKLLGIGLQQIPFLFRQIIAESILNLENNHQSPEYEQLIEKQKHFVKYVTENGDGISVISTNYDDCVPKSLDGLDINMGLVYADNLHEYQVDIHNFMNSKQVQYYPHGHLRFQMTDNSNVTVWNDINTANEKRWNGIRDFANPSTLCTQFDPFAYNFNTFITTGQTKDSSFNNLPYSIYYQRMAIDFANSNNIIIVGYSFGDLHFNRLLNSYLITNPNHSLYIIDYYPGEIAMTYEGRDQDNILFKIQNAFKQPWFVKKDMVTDEILPFYEEEVEKVNTIGYGKIFPRVTFYKKGYASFLDEYTSVIDINVL